MNFGRYPKEITYPLYRYNMKLAKIFTDINDLEKELSTIRMVLDYNKKIVATSGGFDPLHVGHLRCIQESALVADQNGGKLVVIVNGDGFLTRKKGKPFMPHAERMEIVAGLKGVDYVVGWDDGSQTVTGALEVIGSPLIFCKGGDRSQAEKVPEYEFCSQPGNKIIFGVGGRDKIQSSSSLILNAK